MPSITNNTRQTLNFKTGTKDGAVVMDAVKPGETKSVDVATDDVTFVARKHVGAITVNATKALQKAAVDTADRP